MPRKKKRPLAHGDGDVQARTRSDGSTVYQARWYEHDPVKGLLRRARSFESEDAALTHLRTIALEKGDGGYVPPAERTVGELVAEWIERGAHRWKPATVAAYTQRAETHVLPVFGKTLADRLTTPRIQHWIDGLAKSGLDPSTIDNVTRILTGALREAVRIGILPRNAAEGVRRPPIVVREPEVWTDDEIARVTALLDGDPFWSALYRVMLATGMRAGELTALQWRDVDWERGILTIRRTMSKDAEGHIVMGATTKTGRSRQNALSAATMRVLKRWETEQKKRRLACPEWHDAPGIVFDRGDGRPLPQTTWQHRHDQIVQQAGVKRITLHGMRHTHATLALESGQHPLIVSKRLGHSSITTTLDRYSHISIDLHRVASDALDARLFGDDEDATTAREK